uniref:Small RNA 2'-O-methyltransferase n=1 Tax=Xenopsylla cheopis TaxID=163159 RepID=A0A6M2DLH6_XENCH
MLSYPRTEFNPSGKLIFYPSPTEQRYETVLSIISNEKRVGKIKSVVDFGCSNLRFFEILKDVDRFEVVICIDSDKNKLEINGNKTNPFFRQCMEYKDKPFRAKVYHGSIAQVDPCIVDCDAMVCIELIEHLFPQELDNLPFTIFGYAKPQVTVITTPNVEYNILFPENQKSRHEDHKFEWTRDQFKDWANNIVLRYPEYTVEFHDIVPPPKGYEHVGPLTQLAAFYLKSNMSINNDETENLKQNYELMFDFIYPLNCDTRSTEELIFETITDYINRYCRPNDEVYVMYEDESYDIIVPTTELHNRLKSVASDLKDFEEILRSYGHIVNNDHQLLQITPRIRYFAW